MTAAPDIAADPALPQDALAPYPSAIGAWAAVFVLMLANILSTLDRNILGMFVDDIRTDIGITDVQVSLLQGLSFSIIYSVGGVFLGVMADRTLRKWLLCAGMVCWSAAIGLGGLAHGFTSFFASRIMVGLGEATLTPVAVSMIADLFAPHRRAGALSVYMIGLAVAPGVSIFLLGLLSQSARTGALVILAGAPWRTAFAFCGLIGVATAGLVAVIREPPRRGLVLAHGAGLGMAKSAGYLRRNLRFFLPFYAGFALFTVSAYAMTAWAPTTLIRLYDLPAGEIGRLLGGVSIIAGVGGAALAALIAKLAQRGGLAGRLKALALVSLCTIPAGLGALMPHADLAAALFSLMSAALPIASVLSLGLAQDVVPSNMRGLAAALFTLLSSIFGLTLGPLLVAAATQYLFRRPEAVGWSLMIVVVPALALSALAHRQALIGQRRLAATDGELQRVVLGGT
jgi:MFS family permease